MATPKNQSVIKAFTMLKSFHRPDEWVTSSELSRRANLPEASGYRLIQTLEWIGAVVRGPRGRYRPGMLLVSLSHNVAIGELLRETGHAVMAELANSLNVTVHLGLLEGGMVTYAAKVAAPTAFPTHTRVGAQLEAYCSGVGKVLLAALPADQLENFLLEGDLVPLTPYTITEPSILRQQLEEVRKCGFAVDDRENHIELRCVAVPIFDNDGRTVAGMSATDSADRMSPERQAELHQALLKAASSLGSKVFRAGPADKDVALLSPLQVCA
jgi:DNA-binding IclR family transcriptional regulator